MSAGRGHWAGRRVPLEVNLVGWSVSPDRSLALVGDGNGNGLVQLVDLGSMRSLGTVQVDIGATAEASAWLGRRVAVVSGDQAGAPEVVILDPVARPAWWWSAARARSGRSPLGGSPPASAPRSPRSALTT